MSANAPKVRLRSEQTGGEVSVIEIAASPERKGPRLHHHDFDEAFYVLEGQLRPGSSATSTASRPG